MLVNKTILTSYSVATMFAIPHADLCLAIQDKFTEYRDVLGSFGFSEAQFKSSLDVDDEVIEVWVLNSIISLTILQQAVPVIGMTLVLQMAVNNPEAIVTTTPGELSPTNLDTITALGLAEARVAELEVEMVEIKTRLDECISINNF
jgi:hypothetical protein